MSAAPGRQHLLHASCVSFEGRGVLILGAPGSGKSSLALDLMSRGATLVADDQVSLDMTKDGLVATAPDCLHGRIEARGAGIVQVTAAEAGLVMLAVDMDVKEDARLPQLRQFCITDACVPLIAGKNYPNLGSLVMVCLRYGKDPLFLDPER